MATALPNAHPATRPIRFSQRNGISDWTMYRVMNNYEKNPPPYSNPPSTLTPADYTVSKGTSYYDTGYIPADGDGFGAMMEHY